MSPMRLSGCLSIANLGLAALLSAIRTRFMQVQVEIARRNERVASKESKARVEAAAATMLQWIAKGHLERCRFKVNLGAQREMLW